MSEDERYRTSTQFRDWSFTPKTLLERRIQTNQNAAARVRSAVLRIRERRARLGEAAGEIEDTVNSEGEVDCLTTEEESKLVAFYCRQALELGDFLDMPTDVKATAVQYIKRFYISNSVMTYSPADILKTALFFATKTENHYTRLTKFADSLPGTKVDDVLALEFILTQGLRFTFDVRHPFRALEGAVMELLAIAKHDFPLFSGASGPLKRVHDMENRVKIAHGKAKLYLKVSAALTDVYFQYTPSQIMMASLMLADPELIGWYITSKFPPSGMDVMTKVSATIESCAKMLETVNPSPSPSEQAQEKKQMKPLGRKLNKCRNPEKMDLVGLQRAKRDGDGPDERVVKKRKLEREQSLKEGEDLFGPSLKNA